MSKQDRTSIFDKNAKRTYIIAEMSANHGGRLEDAFAIMRAAKESGADCIKIQTYTPDTITINSDKPYFQIEEGLWAGENLYALYGRAYTPWEWHKAIFDEAHRLGMDILSTPFDKTAVDFLESLGIAFYKIASFEVVDIPLIQYVASKGKPVIMSTGMATLGEIEEAVNAVLETGNKNLCLLKCSSAYPAKLDDMNLKTMSNLSEAFKVPVGLSDHSMGSAAPVAAVALGAKVIEKHFCLDRNVETADSAFSMEPAEFKEMVDLIRQTEAVLGEVKYTISEKEAKSRVFRKSIFVVKDMKAGEAFTEENIRIIRPAHGLKPKYYEAVIGEKATCDLERGTPLSWKHIK